MNESNNGHEKVFELGRAKSPEEVARDNVRRSMPSIRRSVNELRMSAPAKWLFGAISDDSFMSDFGGDGFGTLITTFKEIATRYKHDRGSVAKWADELLSRPELLWCEVEWPYVQFHISAFVPCPRLKASAAQKVAARASAARLGRCVEGIPSPGEGVPTPFSDPKNPASSRFAEEIRKTCGDVPARCGEGVPLTCGDVPAQRGEGIPKIRGYLPHTRGVASPSCAGTSPHVVGKVSTHQGETVPTRPASGAVESGQKPIPKKSPSVKGQDLETFFKRSTGLNAQSAVGKPGKNGSENIFLLDVGAMMEGWHKGSAKAELANSGGWWRSTYRSDAGLMRRVLAEITAMVKEGKIKQTPGQAAVDLWQRWDGKIVSPALLKKTPAPVAARA